MWSNSTTGNRERAVKESVKQTNVTLSANASKLILNFLSVSQLDEGSYGCYITWEQNETGQGHLIYVNVTAGMYNYTQYIWPNVHQCAFACICLSLQC